MNVLIFDSSIERARKNAAAFLPSARVFLKRGNQIVSHPKEELVVEPIGCDLVLLHADKADEQLLQNLIGDGSVKVASFLRFSGGGCQDGIPWPVRPASPLTESLANEIVSVCQRFSPGQREQEFKRMWSGVPALLLAWTLSKHFAFDLPTLKFKEFEVAEAFNQLRGALLLRSKSNDLPGECAEISFPRLEDAKLILELARVDL